MNRKIILLLLALVVNLVLAGIMIYNHYGDLNSKVNTLVYLFGYGIIYWLRPFLFVALVRFFFILTNRKFKVKTAIGVYCGVWLVLLIGMFYDY